jgi:hypothetical protein
MAGYVKFHRKMLDHPVFIHDGMFRLWTYCLFRANWKDATTMVPGTLRPIVVRRGQFITGRDKLHVQLYGQDYKGDAIPTSRTLWRWMETLKALDCVSLETMSNRCTLVTVCNYDTYQGDDDSACPAGVQPKSNRRPAAKHADVQPIVPPMGTHASTVEEGKESKKERTKEAAAPLAQIPESLSVPEFVAAWSDWQAHRREIKSPLTETQAAKQLKSLERIGVARAIGMIEHTIEKGWRGLREDESVVKATPASRVPTQEDYDNWTPYGDGVKW